MIPRYKVQEIHDIWSTKNKLNTWLKVEMAHLKSLSENIVDKTITEEEYLDVHENVKVDVDRWKEIEKETKHDLQAFVQMLEESVSDKSGRWIHWGLTSSDILDTSLTLLCKDSLKVIKKYSAQLIYELNQLLQREDCDKPILARTHGKSAEVQTYRNIFNRWISQARRSYDVLVETDAKLKFGKLSGPSGNYTTNTKENEARALDILGLVPVVSSQIISREIYLDYFYSLLKVMLLIEKISYDIRMYSLDGINEMAEPFSKGQKGSSSMPHKKNPVSTENLCGMARLYKAYYTTAIDNCFTLFERDISHSSSERITFKDSAHVAAYSLNRLSGVISGLQLIVENAEDNIQKFESKTTSQKEMNRLIKEGYSRKEAHDIAQLKTKE